MVPAGDTNILPHQTEKILFEKNSALPKIPWEQWQMRINTKMQNKKGTQNKFR